MKASIHASGERRVGYTSEYVRSAQARQTWRGVSRHYDRWEGGRELQPGTTAEFLIRFPTEELRPFPLSESDLAKRVSWFTPAPVGQTVEVMLLYMPSGEKLVPSPDSSSQVVSAGTLSDGRQVYLVGVTVPDDAHTFEDKEHRSQEIAEQLRAAGIPPQALEDNNFRLIVGFNLEGIRGFTEMAANSLDRAASAGAR